MIFSVLIYIASLLRIIRFTDIKNLISDDAYSVVFLSKLHDQF